MTLDLAPGGARLPAAVDEKNLVTAVGFQDRYLDLMDMIKDELPQAHGRRPGIRRVGRRHSRRMVVAEEIHLRRPAGGAEHSSAGRPALSLRRAPFRLRHLLPRHRGARARRAAPEYDTDDHSTVVHPRFQNNVTATLVSGCYTKGVRPNCGLVITPGRYDHRLSPAQQSDPRAQRTKPAISTASMTRPC